MVYGSRPSKITQHFDNISSTPSIDTGNKIGQSFPACLGKKSSIKLSCDEHKEYDKEIHITYWISFILIFLQENIYAKDVWLTTENTWVFFYNRRHWYKWKSPRCLAMHVTLFSSYSHELSSFRKNFKYIYLNHLNSCQHTIWIFP